MNRQLYRSADALVSDAALKGLFENYRYDRGVEQALSLCLNGQLYRSADALISDAALSDGGEDGTSGTVAVRSVKPPRTYAFKEVPMPVNGLPPYDDQNVFARILRGEIPCTKVYEDDFALAFHDINPQTPTHILLIPKGPYSSFADFSASASEVEIAGFFRAAGRIAKDHGLEATGYRLLTNMGEHAGQEVGHFHFHLFAGRPLGRMIPRG